MTPVVSVQDCVEALPVRGRSRRRQLSICGRTHQRPPRPQRRRQDHADALLTGQRVRHRRHRPGLRRDPVENEDVLRRMVFVKEGQAYPDIPGPPGAARPAPGSTRTGTRRCALAARRLRAAAARRSRSCRAGMRSALGIIDRAGRPRRRDAVRRALPGLDAVARQLFYDRLLADFAEYPAHRGAVHPPHRRGRRPVRARHGHRPRPGRPGRAGRRPARHRHHGDAARRPVEEFVGRREAVARQEVHERVRVGHRARPGAGDGAAPGRRAEP